MPGGGGGKPWKFGGGIKPGGNIPGGGIPGGGGGNCPPTPGKGGGGNPAFLIISCNVAKSGGLIGSIPGRSGGGPLTPNGKGGGGTLPKPGKPGILG